jgi:hypothetical protein
MVRTAAALLVLNGVGFGVFCIPAIRSIHAGLGFPIVFGFPAYGGGPFERVGIPTTVALLSAFLLICVLEIAAGGLVWAGSRSGAVLALVLVPVGAIFWWGFALPIPPILAVIRTVLITMSWGAFK